jgi:peptidoglycan/LPS O-acetylase OafA/YrhL
LPALDGLRGVAILLVLLRHSWGPFAVSVDLTVPVVGWNAAVFLANGWVGVDLFFVLSGFLITAHILHESARNAGSWYWRPYVARRALRIVPAYYAVLALVLAGAFPYYEVGGEYLGARVAYHLLFLQDYLPANFVVAFWSLGVEEKFYLLAPPLVLVFARRARPGAWPALVVGLLVAAVSLRALVALRAGPIDDYTSFFYRLRSPFHVTLDPLLVGVGIALIHAQRERWPTLTSRTAGNIVAVAGLGAFLALTATHEMMMEITWWDKTLQPLAVALAFGALVHGALFGDRPAALLRGVALFLLARLSYCLYLVHMPLIPLALQLTGPADGGTTGFAAFAVCLLGLSIAVALVLHFGVEKPFLQLKSKIGAPGARLRPRLEGVHRHVPIEGDDLARDVFFGCDSTGRRR